MAEQNENHKGGCMLEGSFASFDREARAGGTLDVVFLGGSLTWGANATDPNRSSYRARMGQYLQERYPKAHIRNHDAAIGGTGSDLGMFRLERDVLSHSPELVFLEFTVNDGILGNDVDHAASYEYILRTLIAHGIPVEIVMFGNKLAYQIDFPLEKAKRRLQHMKLAEAYGTALGDTYPYIREKVASQTADLNRVYCFDSVHPDDDGYRLFFEAARNGFEAAVKERAVCTVPEQPVFPAKYAWAKRLRLLDTELPNGWHPEKNYRQSLWYDGLSSRWQDGVVACAASDKAIIEPLNITFEGTRVFVFGEADDRGASFTATIDGGKATKHIFNTKRFKQSNGRLFQWRILASNLEPGPHRLEIVPIFSEDETQSQLRIESVCYAGPSAQDQNQERGASK